MLRQLYLPLFLLLYGCTSSTIIYQATGTSTHPGYALSNLESAIINPDELKIKSEKSGRFYFENPFHPETPHWHKNGIDQASLAKVESTDIWRITHAYKNYYIIQSETFNERQCRQQQYGDFITPFGTCSRYNDYGLWYSPAQRSILGWVNLPGPRRILHNRTVELILPSYYLSNQPKGVDWPNIRN